MCFTFGSRPHTHVVPNAFITRKHSTEVQGTQHKKHIVAANWRTHLRQQYHDRLLYWHLRWFSRQYRRQCPASSLQRCTTHSVLTIIIDSMDKSKLVWPQYSFRKPKSLDKLLCPRMVCILAIAHGWTCEFVLTDDEVLSHGASHFCEVLSRTLDRVAEIAERDGIQMHRHLVIQSDNTSAREELLGGTIFGHLSLCWQVRDVHPDFF